MNKSAVRELTFKLLYSLEVQKNFEEENIQLFFENMELVNTNIQNDIKNSVTTIVEKNDLILEQISNNLKSDWKIERLSKVNVVLLKLAIYEMLYKEVPYKVVINEVVELAKKYGEDTSANFINGVLATVVKENKLQ
ncbi:MAG: transcription antitermination factor NusB [Clostridiales bacterium]|nr:transcription antitermination factor NusB [Clostridiales bacterium]